MVDGGRGEAGGGRCPEQPTHDWMERTMTFLIHEFRKAWDQCQGGDGNRYYRYVPDNRYHRYHRYHQVHFGYKVLIYNAKVVTIT